jgi:ABC-type transport system involved in cytochrome bd biosynthesis fused ATPase/permease subunit
VHLDAATEATVVTGLRRVLEGRSAFIVTHRPAVADLADRVVRLSGGRFVPAELLAPNGTAGTSPEPAAAGAGAGQ